MNEELFFFCVLLLFLSGVSGSQYVGGWEETCKLNNRLRNFKEDKSLYFTVCRKYGIPMWKLFVLSHYLP